MTPHFHKRWDGYNGKWRLHKYGDPGDYFDMLSPKEMDSREKLNIIVDITDDDDNESCHLCHPPKNYTPL